MTDVTHRATVVAVFRNQPAAERAIADLHAAGFRDEQIGLLVHDRGRPASERVTEDAAGPSVGEGAAAGAAVGGIIGAAGALLIPGIGPVLATGILAGLLGGAVVGAVTGGIVGELVGVGIAEDEARYYESEFRSGRTLVAVRADGRGGDARAILRRHGAYDADDRAAASEVLPLVGNLGPAAPPVIVPPPSVSTDAEVDR